MSGGGQKGGGAECSRVTTHTSSVTLYLKTEHIKVSYAMLTFDVDTKFRNETSTLGFSSINKPMLVKLTLKIPQ